MQLDLSTHSKYKSFSATLKDAYVLAWGGRVIIVSENQMTLATSNNEEVLFLTPAGTFKGSDEQGKVSLEDVFSGQKEFDVVKTHLDVELIHQ
jgi:hypothetical protein